MPPRSAFFGLENIGEFTSLGKPRSYMDNVISSKRCAIANKNALFTSPFFFFFSVVLDIWERIANASEVL